ncbi:hydroxymethylpyrimidine/phosphomethylpyrimidine kinase [Flavobacterium hercynium]|uniref:hydroxymethylpyrimidine kinase n=1 Tax=Flavobacterium hercynium TaxID=387094 RepID=A0A226HS64_9FLAO|nr:hydroxymethylpyrimidine/phosphomethylpyrimidine kinase [Flavobacterium hercynium]OXA96310.1 hydroxymethylpyrimidine/phosphomethylpyrimidine kinase [Flavobacterium hercynium]SMP04185.1 hydroxymethylpyrimidine/phosphomethylpyrimidine kinase [Flavobacterium hercynium]
MSKNRPFVLSIAGLDPTGGAGILADTKTFEQHQVNGFAIITANTIQTENAFFEIQWTDLNFVIRSIEKLFEQYQIKAVKIGIVPNLNFLNKILSLIKLLSPTTKIVWDPVLKSTSRFEFMKVENDDSDLNTALSKIDLITPNYNEMELLFPDFIDDDGNLKTDITTTVLLKGGHHPDTIGIDRLYLKNERVDLFPSNMECCEKHGSGCVLSSAIAANLALDQDLETACKNAKIYIEKYLSSSSTLIGYHYVH